MLAIPGFFAEQSLRAFQLRYYLGNAPAPGPHSRLRPMLSEPWVDYYLSEVFGGGTGGTDAGVAAGPDGGTPDGGTPDAGTPDAGAPDAGAPDAGPQMLAQRTPICPSQLG